MNFTVNPQKTSITYYCPGNTSDEKIVDDFYSDWKRLK